MQRTKAECARVVIEILKPELAAIFCDYFHVQIVHGHPGGLAAMTRFAEEGLSGVSKFSKTFVKANISEQFVPDWGARLGNAGVTMEELRRHGFLDGQRGTLDVSGLVSVNSVNVPSAPIEYDKPAPNRNRLGRPKANQYRPRKRVSLG